MWQGRRRKIRRRNEVKEGERDGVRQDRKREKRKRMRNRKLRDEVWKEAEGDGKGEGATVTGVRHSIIHSTTEVFPAIAPSTHNATVAGDTTAAALAIHTPEHPFLPL